MTLAHALAREELVRALVVHQGITTSDGNVGKTSLIDSSLIGSNDFVTEKTILIGTGNSAREDRGAISFNPATGEITVVSAFSARIMAGTIYKVLNISSVELDIAFALARIGANTDPAGTTTLFAWLANIGAGVLPTRVQKGTQATTAVLTVVGAAIESATPFKASGFLSLHNMQAGDTFLVIEEVRDQDDATYREYGRNSFSDVQTSPMVWLDPKVCQGWRLRIQRTAGGDRNVTYQFFVGG